MLENNAPPKAIIVLISIEISSPYCWLRTLRAKMKTITDIGITIFNLVNMTHPSRVIIYEHSLA